MKRWTILAFIAIGFVRPFASVAETEARFLKAIELLDRENTRLELEEYQFFSDKQWTPGALKYIPYGPESFAAFTGSGGIGAGAFALMAGYANVMDSSSGTTDPLWLTVDFSYAVAHAGAAVYLIALAGNALKIWNTPVPDGKSAGALSLVGAGVNFHAAYRGYQAWADDAARFYLTLWGWPKPVIYGAGLSAASAGLFLTYEGIDNLSLSPTSRRTAQLDPAMLHQDDESSIRRATDRVAHLFRVDKNPRKVSQLRELITDVANSRKDVDLFSEIADLQDDMGEDLIPEEVVTNAQSFLEMATRSLPYWKDHLPEKLSLREGASKRLKLLQSHIARLHQRSEAGLKADYSDIIESAERCERRVQLIMGII